MEPPIRKRGAIAVIRQSDELLAIQRSQLVAAPGKICFPGGGIEPGESETDALVRELDEELGCPIVPIQKIHESVTPWGVALAWWLAEFALETPLKPDPTEVADYRWSTIDALLADQDLLESNQTFLQEVNAGLISLQ